MTCRLSLAFAAILFRTGCFNALWALQNENRLKELQETLDAYVVLQSSPFTIHLGLGSIGSIGTGIVGVAFDFDFDF